MKTQIRILALALSCALISCAQSVPDAPEVQVDATSVAEPDSSMPDARPAIVPDAAPAAPVEVQCVTYPAVESYNAQSRVTLRTYHRYADIGFSNEPVYVCGNTNFVPASTCDEARQNCTLVTGPYPDLRCYRAWPMEDTSGRYFINCGFLMEQDPDGDGVFTVIGDYTYTVEIR